MTSVGFNGKGEELPKYSYPQGRLDVGEVIGRM